MKKYANFYNGQAKQNFQNCAVILNSPCIHNSSNTHSICFCKYQVSVLNTCKMHMLEADSCLGL